MGVAYPESDDDSIAMVSAARSPFASQRLGGIASAVELTGSAKLADVLRGLRRLGAVGTAEATSALVTAAQNPTGAGTDVRARLTAVRQLAPHAITAEVVAHLTAELSATAGSSAEGSAPPSPGLLTLLRGTAALALARAGTASASAALVEALGPNAGPNEAARVGLRATPVAALDALLEGSGRRELDLSLFLAEVGDLRAVAKLRDLSAPEVDVTSRANAAVARARLGDGSVLALADEWMGLGPAKKPDDADAETKASGDPRLWRAAAEIYLLLQRSKAATPFAKLVDRPASVGDALALAMRLPATELVPALSGGLARMKPDDRLRAYVALSRAGGEAATKVLEGAARGTLPAPAEPDDDKGTRASSTPPEVSQPEREGAWLALARVGDATARAAIEKLLDDPAVRGASPKDEALQVLAVRVGLVRALELAEAPAGLAERLEEMATSNAATPRSVATFGLVALGRRDVRAELRAVCPEAFSPAPAPASGASAAATSACRVALVGAIARGALVRGTDALAPLHEVLQWVDRTAPQGTRAPTPLALAAGLGLVAFPKGEGISASRLAGWAEAGGPLAPLAARALASRDTVDLEPAIRRLWKGTDPVVRQAVALGLAHDERKHAVSLLSEAYEFEDDVAVRRGIVRALSARREPQRSLTLALARDLDPDAGVRDLARNALAGRALDRSYGLGTEVAWITASGMVGELAARVVRADGLALCVTSDPDGALLVPGLPVGVGSVELAPLGAPPSAAGAP